MPLSLIRQDITRLSVDAIVNAANEGLRAGGGVCGAIFSAAGHDDLQRACDEIGHVDTGDAVATPGFALAARHIIHTAGPVWHGGSHGEKELLASCYRSSLNLAFELGDTSIAFPLISSGIFGYPPAEALAVAVGEIRAFLEDHPDFEVTLCLFDRRATTLTQDFYGAIEQYVDDTYVEDNPFARNRESEANYYGALWEDTDALADYAMPDGMPTFGSAAPTAPAAPAATAAPGARARIGLGRRYRYDKGVRRLFAGEHAQGQA
jgi:O-acetyl-ADP-ribose deacetylase (regulator of RNase III)